MKKLQDINTEIEELLIQAKEVESDETMIYKLRKSNLKRIDKRVTFLRIIRNYLELNPSEQFVQSELARLEKREALINKSYEQYTPKFPDNKKSEFRKDNDLVELELQINTLKYIVE